MTRAPQRLVDYLGHILEAIDVIHSYTADLTEAEFLDTRMVRDAVIRNLEIIGEASRSIQQRFPEFAAAYPDSAPINAWEMRNRLIHGYFDVDLTVVWTTVQD